MGLITGAVVFAASAAVTVLVCQIYDRFTDRGGDEE
jgi:hypothetical protein